MKSKKTLQGISIPTKDVYQAVLAEIRREYHKLGQFRFVDEELYQIRCENPPIYNLINKFSGDEEDIALGMIFVYRFIKAQAGVDKVEEMWFPEKLVKAGETSFRIPSKLLESLGWEDGEGLEAEVTDDSLIIKRPKKD